jgi:hypothetical protein
MVPLLSASTSLIISCSSDSEGFWPSERMTVPSSLVVICPSERIWISDIVSNFSRASMAQSVLPGIERPSYWRRLHSPSPSLSCSQAGKPAPVSLLYFPRSERSMDALESTHKQGEGLLVLGDLLFGQRIGLYADTKVLVSQEVLNTRIAAPLCGDVRGQDSCR